MAAKEMLAVLMLMVACGFSVAREISWRNTKPIPVWQRGDDWCDDILGCLSITPEWNVPTRPFNLKPYSRRIINTKFKLHTRAYPAFNGDTIFLDADEPSTISASTFDPSKPTKFITHGYIDDGNVKWMKQLAEALLDYGDYNVIRVGWGGGSLPLYTQATANTRVVGLEIGHMVNTMISEFGVDPANVHLMGHSLGSHVCGYAGEKISGLGRITGMDPAGPYFTATKTFMRLDETDAVFVDAIHTDADSILIMGYGTDQAMGNLDFYPNGGHEQPGCDPVNIGIDMITDIGDGGRELVACNHQRAINFVIDSLRETCPLLAHECGDHPSFELGRCASCMDDNSHCAYMGIRADEYTKKERTNVHMYLDTGKDMPYCLYHYQVIVDTAHPSAAEDWVQGHISLFLYGDEGTIANYKITKEHERFDHGQKKYFLLKSPTDIGNLVSLEIKWEYDQSLFNPGSYCFMLLCNRSLYVSNVTLSNISKYPESNRLEHTYLTCDQGGKDVVRIKDGKKAEFVADASCKSINGKRA